MNKTSEKTFYDAFWQTQTGLSCDEKCRMRFIVSEVKRLRKNLAALASGPMAAQTEGAQAGNAQTSSVQTGGAQAVLNVADVGCGRGWLSAILSRFGQVTGFDMSTAEAQKRNPAGHFVEYSVLDPSPGLAGQFDLAVCSEVIEHIRREEKPRLIESLSSILRPGGALIMTTPNKPKVSLLVRELSLERELQPVEDWLEISELIELVRAHFDVEKTATLMFFPIALRKIGPLSRAYRALYEQLSAYRLLDPLLQGSRRGLYIGLIGRKKRLSP